MPALLLKVLAGAIPLGFSNHKFMFLPCAGESDLRFLCQSLGSQLVYGLPVIQNHRRMFFYSWAPGRPLKPNAFGIPEPTSAAQSPLQVDQATLMLVLALAMEVLIMTAFLLLQSRLT